MVGLSAVLTVQTRAKADIARSLVRETRANAELTRSQAAVQGRYDLAVEAIKAFHTGVSEDVLLQQDQFKEVRDRLLKSASDFYGRLGALLGKESDLARHQVSGEFGGQLQHARRAALEYGQVIGSGVRTPLRRSRSSRNWSTPTRTYPNIASCWLGATTSAAWPRSAWATAPAARPRSAAPGALRRLAVAVGRGMV